MHISYLQKLLLLNEQTNNASSVHVLRMYCTFIHTEPTASPTESLWVYPITAHYDNNQTANSTAKGVYYSSKAQSIHSLTHCLRSILIKMYIPMNLCAQLLYVSMNLCAQATAHFDEPIKTEVGKCCRIKRVADERTWTSRNSFFSQA